MLWKDVWMVSFSFPSLLQLCFSAFSLFSPSLSNVVKIIYPCLKEGNSNCNHSGRRGKRGEIPLEKKRSISFKPHRPQENHLWHLTWRLSLLSCSRFLFGSRFIHFIWPIFIQLPMLCKALSQVLGTQNRTEQRGTIPDWLGGDRVGRREGSTSRAAWSAWGGQGSHRGRCRRAWDAFLTRAPRQPCDQSKGEPKRRWWERLRGGREPGEEGLCLHSEGAERHLPGMGSLQVLNSWKPLFVFFKFTIVTGFKKWYELGRIVRKL